MKKLHLLLHDLMLALGIAAPGKAGAMEAIAKELNAYHESIIVLDTKSKKTCNIEGQVKDYQNHLDAQLRSLGIADDEKSGLAAVLLITSQNFAIAGSHCVLHVELSFQTRIPPEMFTRLTDAQQAALNRIGSLPVSVWNASAMAVAPLLQPSAGGESDMAQKAVIRLIDAIVDLLRTQRQ
ncbi:MAG: hypothetical protein JJ959_19825 [Nisaea sp.]|uniref:hypothetical protein n=1 Tax=Nisaea sp. TaxID=2024842 RepID=UPI001B15E89C|nr:hypothetical protein [Nisaea sp.]MBO6562808.1 hypothetical protein [Nisaea sp.]